MIRRGSLEDMTIAHDQEWICLEGVTIGGQARGRAKGCNFWDTIRGPEDMMIGYGVRGYEQ